jgi:DNA adenine methylase
VTGAARPFLRWPGGKRSLAPALLERAPARWKGHYVEPFVGGGALFFELHRLGRLGPKGAVLADANARLVRTYRAVRDDVDAVLEAFRRVAPPGHVFTKDEYNELRALDPDAMPDHDCAAWLIAISRLCIKGLYRVNQKEGKFNVPFGDKKRPPDPGEANLRACSAALQGVHVLHADFAAVLRNVDKHDFVYADPPYDSEDGSGFVAYTAEGFGDKDQERLAKALRQAALDGTAVMASNNLTSKVLEWYRGAPFVVGCALAPRPVGGKEGGDSVVEALVTGGYDPPARQRPRPTFENQIELPLQAKEIVPCASATSAA